MTAKTFALTLVAAAALAAPCAQAATLSLYNTGVDAFGVVLPNATLGDPHYELISTPSGAPSAVRVLTSEGGYPILPGIWLADSNLSRWITPESTGQEPAAGEYTYRTTFDMSYVKLDTASIIGQWSTDNSGLNILLNGVALGFTSGDLQFSSGYAPFSINSGFVQGMNTLDFVLTNRYGPTGLRVEMSGTAEELPEPGSLALVGMALAGLALSRRRKA